MTADVDSRGTSHRDDPYQGFEFRIKMDGRYVAAVSRVLGISPTSRVGSHGSAGGPSKPRLVPGQTEHGPIVLERGVTHDIEFEQWANRVWDYDRAGEELQRRTSSRQLTVGDLSKEIIIELRSAAGQTVAAFTLHRAWPSEFTAMPELDANGESVVAIETLKLEYERWEQDDSVREPPEPSFELPSG